MKQLFSICLLVLLLCSCNQNPKVTNKEFDAKALLLKAVEAHGGDLYKSSTISFELNNYEFLLQRDGYNYVYEMSSQNDTAKFTARTFNGGFKFFVNGEESSQGSRMDGIVGNRLTSVVYDFYLPYELLGNDAIHSYDGQEPVRGKMYHKVRVTFKQIDPEVPDQRIMMLWIDQKTHEIDFIGKQNGDEKSRKQFMAAANKRRQSGMLIFDYENYQTTQHNKDAAIDSLAFLYNAGFMRLGRTTIYDKSEVIINK